MGGTYGEIRSVTGLVEFGVQDFLDQVLVLGAKGVA